MTGVVGPTTFGKSQSQGADEHGEPGVLGHRLRDEGDQLAHGATLVADDGQLGTEDDGDVGFTDVGTDLEGLRGQPFCLDDVSRYLRPRGAPERQHPVQSRLDKPLDR
jgi:hypothetical protein